MSSSSSSNNLPSLSSLDFFPASKAPAPTTLPTFAIPLGRRTSFNSGRPGSSGSSASSSSTSSGTSSAVRAATPYDGPAAYSAARPQHQQPFNLPQGREAEWRRASEAQARSTPMAVPTKRNNSWSPHQKSAGGITASAPSRPPCNRRPSNLRLTFVGELDSERAAKMQRYDPVAPDDQSLEARGRAWSFDSEEEALIVDGQADPRPAAHRLSSDGTYRAAASPNYLEQTPLASPRQLHGSHEIQTLFRSANITTPSFEAERPSFGRHISMDPNVQRLSTTPSPPQSSAVFSGGAVRAVTPPERGHPYQRTSEGPVSPQKANPDSRRAFTRSTKACDSCRSRKTRCTSYEGSRTCVRCEEMGQSCAWSESVKKRGPANGSVRPKASRSESSQSSTGPATVTPSPNGGQVYSAVGWTSNMPSTARAVPDYRLQPSPQDVSPPLACSGWSQPQRPSPPAEYHHHRSGLFPPSIALPPPAASRSWSTSPASSASAEGPSPPQQPQGLGLAPGPGTTDEQLVFLGDNTLTLPPLRVALGRAPSF